VACFVLPICRRDPRFEGKHFPIVDGRCVYTALLRSKRKCADSRSSEAAEYSRTGHPIENHSHHGYFCHRQKKMRSITEQRSCGVSRTHRKNGTLQKKDAVSLLSHLFGPIQSARSLQNIVRRYTIIIRKHDQVLDRHSSLTGFISGVLLSLDPQSGRNLFLPKILTLSEFF